MCVRLLFFFSILSASINGTFDFNISAVIRQSGVILYSERPFCCARSNALIKKGGGKGRFFFYKRLDVNKAGPIVKPCGIF